MYRGLAVRPSRIGDPAVRMFVVGAWTGNSSKEGPSWAVDDMTDANTVIMHGAS